MTAIRQRAKKTKNPDDWTIAKNLRNNTGRIIDLAKRNFFEEEYLASKDDPKRFWRNINRIIPSKKTKSTHINMVNENNEDIDSEKISDYINTFFTTIGPNLASRNNEKWKYYGLESANIIDDLKFHRGEPLLLIDNIDTTKSSGFQNISSMCLKDALSVLVSQLLYIKENVSNYRPVSLLPIPGKLLERIVHDHMMTFFEKNKLISDMQNGIRKNHSTLSSIIDLTGDIYKSINNKEITIAAFIDLKKAFDTVNHKILMEKSNYMGIKRKCLNWILDYLSNQPFVTMYFQNLKM